MSVLLEAEHLTKIFFQKFPVGVSKIDDFRHLGV